MAVLNTRATLLALVAFATSCYAPDLADCQVVCSTDDDCAADQACSSGLCTAGTTCGGSDNGGATITLRVEVMGHGRVIVPGVGECDKGGPMGRDCVFEVPRGELTLSAVVSEPGKPFERWTSIKCFGQGPQCSDVFVTDATVAAKFR